MKRGPTVPLAVRRGSVGSRWGPQSACGDAVGSRMGPYNDGTSIVHRYGTVERYVELHRVPSCQNRVLTETRRIARLSRIDVPLIYGPLRDHMGP